MESYDLCCQQTKHHFSEISSDQNLMLN